VVDVAAMMRDEIASRRRRVQIMAILNGMEK
jgi:hypothetical protein